ncbi:metalloproteinase, extracellular matrix glycoprotein VMP15, partial [Volvox carteri f. nagariensis]
VIRKSDGSVLPIARGYQPPKADNLGQVVVPGALVSCNLDAVGICNPVLGSRTIVLSAKPLLLPDTDTIQQRLLVIVMDYSACRYPATMNQTTVRTIFLGRKGDGSGGIAQRYTQCSYGKFNLNTTAFKVITAKSTVPCTDVAVKQCADWRIAQDGDARAKAVLGEKEFSSFTHYAYIIPGNMSNSQCAWKGLAYLPGQQIWLKSTTYSVSRWSTVMQEALHNYGGLWHSWENGVEYEDYSTAMGSGVACPNAPELAYLDWATPAPGGDRIDSNLLPAGTALTFSLPATYLSPDGNYLRIVPDWLPSYRTNVDAKNLYIAVRVNKGGDSSMTLYYANKLNIHEVNAIMVRQYVYSDRKVSFVTAAAPQSRTNLTAYKLVVYGGSWVSTDILRIHVCRYQSSLTECPS